jgi:SAM-dependent methyltransferase
MAGIKRSFNSLVGIPLAYPEPTAPVTRGTHYENPSVDQFHISPRVVLSKAVKDKQGIEAVKKRLLLPGLAVKDGYTRHPFDLEFGVRTSGLIAGRNLKSGHRADGHNTAYFGVAPSVFREMIVRWRRTKPVAPIDDFTFVDLGAGMGRALLLASEYPFRAAIGVELNPTLARIGRRNMALWRAAGRARTSMRMVCRDAAEFELPQGPCVVFLFNPFGATIMRKLLKLWSRSFARRERQLDILYVNNEHDVAIRQQPGFERLFDGEVRRTRADAIADHKIMANQPDGEYAVTIWEDCSIYRWMGTANT